MLMIRLFYYILIYSFVKGVILGDSYIYGVLGIQYMVIIFQSEMGNSFYIVLFIDLYVIEDK